MGLARKLLNKSIRFEEQQSKYDGITHCIVAVLSFDTIIVDYAIQKGRLSESYSIRMNAHEFVEFIKQGDQIEQIAIFDTGSKFIYTKIELLKEIAKRKRSFFDDSDKQSFISLISEIQLEKDRSDPLIDDQRSNDKKNAQKRVTQGDSKRFSDEKTDSNPQQSNKIADKEPKIGVLKMPTRSK